MAEVAGLHELLARIRAAGAPACDLPERPAAGRPGLTDGDREHQIGWLATRLADLRGPGDDAPALVRVADAAAADSALRALVGDTPRSEVLWPGDPFERRDYALGVTPAVAVIAETGSAILDVADHAAAWASLAVDTHVVCANADDLAPDLVTCYAMHGARIGTDLGGVQVQVTGASRTADVEKILVVPAHGPQRLVMVLADAAVDWAGVFAAVSS